MKIINSLYIKVILLAIVSIIAVTEYFKLQELVKEQTIHAKPLKTKTKTTINKLKKELAACQKETANLQKQKECKNNKYKVEIIEKVKIKTKIKRIMIDKYKKVLFYNIHHQILQELKYAPYLPVFKLQKMMEERFVLKDIGFKISIKKYNGKIFKGIRLEKDTTRSIIRDNELLEVKYYAK